MVSEAGDVNGALAEPLAQLAAEGDRLVQFRLDDDDCLPVNYVTLLRRATAAMRRYHAFSFSLPRALLITNYRGQGPRRYELVAPHHAQGWRFVHAVRRRRCSRSGITALRRASLP